MLSWNTDLQKLSFRNIATFPLKRNARFVFFFARCLSNHKDGCSNRSYTHHNLLTLSVERALLALIPLGLQGFECGGGTAFGEEAHVGRGVETPDFSRGRKRRLLSRFSLP